MIRSLRPAVGGAALALTVLMGGAVLLPGSRGPFRAADAATRPAAASRVTARYRFTVGPDGGRFALGVDTIIIPAHAICDPRTSGYGEGTWDRSCAPAVVPIEVTAEVRESPAAARGAPGARWIDFSPDLRFVPSADSAHWVRLTYRGRAGSGTPIAAPLGSQASPKGGVAVTTATPGAVQWRRIRHFSGYQVHAG